jgi:hypothetical protein
MGRVIGFFIGVLVLGTLLGVAIQVGASVAYQSGANAVAPAAYYWHPFAFGFLPFFGLLFPLLFIFLIVGAARAAFGGGHGGHRWGNGPRMFEEWHRKEHERVSGSGKAES